MHVQAMGSVSTVNLLLIGKVYLKGVKTGLKQACPQEDVYQKWTVVGLLHGWKMAFLAEKWLDGLG